MRKRTDKDTAKAVINELGGTKAVAVIVGVSPASVSGWRTHGIPEGRLLYLQKVFSRNKTISKAQANIQGR